MKKHDIIIVKKPYDELRTTFLPTIMRVVLSKRHSFSSELGCKFINKSPKFAHDLGGNLEKGKGYFIATSCCVLLFED